MKKIIHHKILGNLEPSLSHVDVTIPIWFWIPGEMSPLKYLAYVQNQSVAFCTMQLQPIIFLLITVRLSDKN